jgi:competence protein ComEA
MRYTKHLLASLTVGFPLLVWGAMPSITVHAAQQQGTPVAQAGQDPTAGMPDGPGKDITVKTCTKCHSITNITGAHKDTDGWTATITKMVGYGATGSDDDFQAILDYLSKNYGLNPPPASSTAPPAAK